MGEGRGRHCWAGYRESLDCNDLRQAELWIASWDAGDATCMLPADHLGPHEWTPDDEIRVEFR